MADAAEIAGYIATNPAMGYWPGLSSITQVFENYFAPGNAVKIGGNGGETPGVFAAVKDAAANALRDVTGPAALEGPSVTAATAVVSQASRSAQSALDFAESGLEKAGKAVTSTVDKIGTGLEWGLIALFVIVGLWIVAQFSTLVPRRN